MTENIKNERELVKKLKNDIKTTDKKTVVFIGGHFPLLYNSDSDAATAGLSKWGIFSIYTLELSCLLGRYAKRKHKEVKFMLDADDHIYEDFGGLLPRQRSAMRNRFYKSYSGLNAQLPQPYKEIFKKYGFSEKDLIRHDHGKSNRHDCLIFSEKVLRASSRDIDNACAREYVEFIEEKNYFNKENSYLVAFMPRRCQGHLCDVALDKEITGLSASHVFMETLNLNATRKDLYKTGVGVNYRKD